MITVGKNHAFRENEKVCWLSLSADYTSRISWQIHIKSMQALARFGENTGPTSFAIHVETDLGVRDWMKLTRRSFSIPRDSLRSAFNVAFDQFAQWEDISILNIRFGEINANRIMCEASGRALVEAVPDLFPEGAVDFAFEGPLRFNGISLLLPKDVGDPVEYAKERLGILAPSYIYSDLKIRKTALDEASPQTIEILAPPAF